MTCYTLISFLHAIVLLVRLWDVYIVFGSVMYAVWWLMVYLFSPVFCSPSSQLSCSLLFLYSPSLLSLLSCPFFRSFSLFLCHSLHLTPFIFYLLGESIRSAEAGMVNTSEFSEVSTLVRIPVCLGPRSVFWGWNINVIFTFCENKMSRKRSLN